MSVIGGWFFTAFSAFTAAFLLALLFSWGGFVAIIIMMLIALFIVIKTHGLHKRRASEQQKQEEYETINQENILQKSADNIIETLSGMTDVYKETIEALGKESLKKLKKVHKKSEDISKSSKRLKDNIHRIVDELQDDMVETGHYYVQVLDYLREIGHATNYITEPALEHIMNNHKGLTDKQVEELNKIHADLAIYSSEVGNIIRSKDFSKVDKIGSVQQELLKLIDNCRKNQIKRIKKSETGTKNSMLYLNILQESKNLVLFIMNMLKSYRDFVIYDNQINGTGSAK